MLAKKPNAGTVETFSGCELPAFLINNNIWCLGFFV